MNAPQCELAPINNQIIFEFIEDVGKGKFNTKTVAGLFVIEGSDKQVDYCRWGRILAMGPDVTDFSIGDIVLLDKMRWTKMFMVTTTPYWISTDEEIMAIWDDPSRLPA